MPSFEIFYDEDEDVLEATFATFDESTARTIALSENVTLYTDLMFQHAWGIAIYDYAALREQEEVFLEELAELSTNEARRIVRVASQAPISLFLEITNPENFRAKVKSPALHEIIG